MNYIYRVAALAVVALLAGCGPREGDASKPAQGPAAVGPAPITLAKATPAKPVETNAKTVKPDEVGKTAKSQPPAKPAVAATETKPASTSGPFAPRTTETKPAAPVPSKLAAKVVMVKAEPEYRFVVIEFSSPEIPSAGSQLTTYRGKERTATVKVTEPVRPPHVTADILDGQPRVGDEVR